MTYSIIDLGWSLFVQFYISLREALAHARRGNFKKGLIWLIMRNYISLWPNRNSSRIITIANYQYEKFGIIRFDDLLPGDLVDSLSNRYIQSFRNSESIADLGSLSEELKAKGYRRGPQLSINDDIGSLRLIIKAFKLNDLLPDLLGLDSSRIVVNATIDCLVSYKGDVNYSYDDALALHRDVDSFRFSKFFLYLTDVSEGNGHHEVYLSSHRGIPLRLRFIQRYRDEDMALFKGEATLLKVVGPAGTAFLENTTAFHRGTLPNAGSRLSLQICFNDKFTIDCLGQPSSLTLKELAES